MKTVTYLSTNDIFILISAIIIGGYFYLLELTFRKNKIFGFFALLFPPLIITAVYKYWSDAKNPLIYIFIFVIFLSMLGLTTGNNYAADLYALLKKLSLWQSHLIIMLYPKINALVQ